MKYFRDMSNVFLDSYSGDIIISNKIKNSSEVYRLKIDIPFSTWKIYHSLGTDKLIIHTIDLDENEIIPENITVKDKNNIAVEFNTKVAGYCVIYPIYHETNIEYETINNSTI